jgi:hypothetical protein
MDVLRFMVRMNLNKTRCAWFFHHSLECGIDGKS